MYGHLRGRAFWLTALWVLLTASLNRSGSGDRAGHMRARACPTSARLTILFTGDTESYLRPCGCQPSSPGGLARRATMIRRLGGGRRGSILLDVGNLAGPDPGAVSDAAFVLRVLKELHYAACGLGREDLSMGVSGLIRLAQGSRLPFVAADVPAAVGGRAIRVYPALLVRCNGLRVAVTSLPDGPPGGQGVIPTVVESWATGDVRGQA